MQKRYFLDLDNTYMPFSAANKDSLTCTPEDQRRNPSCRVFYTRSYLVRKGKAALGVDTVLHITPSQIHTRNLKHLHGLFNDHLTYLRLLLVGVALTTCELTQTVSRFRS